MATLGILRKNKTLWLQIGSMQFANVDREFRDLSWDTLKYVGSVVICAELGLEELYELSRKCHKFQLEVYDGFECLSV